MIRLLFFFLLLFPLALRAQDMSRVRATLDSLCAPRMHGRGYVNYGDRHAAAFLKKQFEQIGLKTLRDGTYFQFFTLTVNTFPDRVALQTGKKLLQTGNDVIAAPNSGSGSGRAKVLYLDSAAVATSAARQQLGRSGFRKKAVVFATPLARKMAFGDDSFRKSLTSAAAFITLQPKLTASYAPVQLPQPALEVLQSAWPAGTRKVRFAVDAELLQNHISQNVIGYLPGTHTPDSVIIFSAHYDHMGRMGREAYFPGANDNASGVSMLLELAHYYASNPPRSSVLFIAFGGEEAGLIGSDFYTKHPLLPLSNTRFLINLDLLGTGDDGLMVVNGKVFTREFALLQEINQNQKLLPVIKSRGEAANSDHYHFTRQGVKGFFLYTLGGTTAYHDVHDTPAQLPLTRFREVLQLITRFTDALDKR